mgnify:CR=1 FL=1
MKGQLLLISAVLVSLIMLAAGSAVESMGEQDYDYIEEGYTADIIEQETESLDKTVPKNRENYRRMIGFLTEYQPSISYGATNQCYNVTLSSDDSVIDLNCVGLLEFFDKLCFFVFKVKVVLQILVLVK